MLSFLRKMLLAIFSVYVWSTAFLCMTLMVLFSALLLPVFPFRKTHMWIARPLLSLCIWCSFSRVRIIYHPDYDPKKLSLYNSNHVSALDAHLCARIIAQPYCGLIKAESLKVPIYGWIMRLSQSIPVQPRKSGRTSELVEAARDRVSQGIAIATYAEGGRTPDGKVHPFRRGVFFMARDAGIPVVPVAVRGMYRLLRKGAWLVRPSTITVYMGKQEDISHLSDDEVGEFAERSQRLVADFVEDAKLPDGVTSPWPL